jgi:NitT/TauT family transport system substrate-binding protein
MAGQINTTTLIDFSTSHSIGGTTPMSRKRVAALALSIVALLPVVGCGAIDKQSAAPAHLETVRVGQLALVDAATLHLAIDNKYFEQEGLSVEVTTGEKGSVNIDKVLGGSLDIGMSSYPPAIGAHNKAKPLTVVADAVQTRPGSILLMVKQGGQVKAIGDLIGKKVANSSKRGISELAMISHLKILGLDPTSVSFVSMEIKDMPAQLKLGNVDAAIIAEPHVVTAKREGAIPLYDPFSKHLADFPWSGYLSSAKWVKEHPQTVEKFARAMGKAAELARNDREAVENAIVKVLKINKDQAQLAVVPEWPITVDPIRLQRVVDLMKDTGEKGKDGQPINVNMHEMMVGAALQNP